MSDRKTRILEALKNHPEGMLQTELTSLLGCNQRQTSRSCDALRRWGDIVGEKEGSSKRWRLKCTTEP